MIEFDRLVSLYNKTNRGLSEFTAELNEGKVYGLLGKNGAGKTTLIRTIMGVVFSNSGTCRILDYSPRERRPEMLQEIGLVPEEYQLPAVSPQTYIRYWSKFYPRFDFKLMQNFLKQWSFPESTSLEKLSQGEKKKFIISFVLSTQAQLFLFDEPTNGLDITSKMIFNKIIHDYKKDKLIIISTHQIKDIDRLLEKIIILDQGVHLGTFDREEINRLFVMKLGKVKPKNALFVMEGVDGYCSLEKKPLRSKRKVNDVLVDLEIFYTAFLQEREKILDVFKSVS